jgi:hypothetical protein
MDLAYEGNFMPPFYLRHPLMVIIQIHLISPS